ncbi:MAG: TIGR02466 family protein [Reyranellaceae bacterium]
MRSVVSEVPKVHALFGTPLVVFEVPNARRLNDELRLAIEQRERTHPGLHKSNLGGWQSSPDMDKWGGSAAVRLLAFARNVATRVTTDRQGEAGHGPYPSHFAVTWGANMWANVNRSGHANDLHSHPGAFWSGVYYVDDGGIDADPSLGGELEFVDPRGPLPVMNAPHLGYAMPGGLAAGATERIIPRAGQMVLFPSWMMHQVRVYRGAATRISIAFNLTV